MGEGFQIIFGVVGVGLWKKLRHILFEWSWAHDLWEAAGFSFSYLLGASFRDVFDWCWDNKGREGVEIFVTLAWQICKARNEAIFKTVFDPPGLCVKKALGWLKEYQKALSYGSLK